MFADSVNQEFRKGTLRMAYLCSSEVWGLGCKGSMVGGESTVAPAHIWRLG